MDTYLLSDLCLIFSGYPSPAQHDWGWSSHLVIAGSSAVLAVRKRTVPWWIPYAYGASPAALTGHRHSPKGILDKHQRLELSEQFLSQSRAAIGRLSVSRILTDQMGAHRGCGDAIGYYLIADAYGLQKQHI